MYVGFSQGWVDCWTAPSMSLSVGYTYHPAPILSDPSRYVRTEDDGSDVMTPGSEEQFLIPLKLVREKKVRTENA